MRDQRGRIDLEGEAVSSLRMDYFVCEWGDR